MSQTTSYQSSLPQANIFIQVIFVSANLKKTNMKKIRVYYWITTGLIALLMIFSSISSLVSHSQALAFFDTLRMPSYLIPFLSIAKLLGVIAILIPGYPRITEWAYAGLLYDLIGATYCNYASGKTPGEWLPILIFIGLAFASYFLYHQKLSLQPR
jgi:DoxX-like family